MNSSPLFEKIDAFCIQHSLLPHDTCVILGLSGGPDSLFLLHYLAAKQKAGELTVIAAHLDHQWRTNSDDDVKFCQQVTNNLGVEFVAAKATELLLQPKFNGSKEELGRALRRHFFETVQKKYQAESIALAHQQDDQFETFFIRLLRGATTSGLRAMRPAHKQYVRPLLMTSRAEIIAHLNEHSINYLTDPSNESSLFLRNRIRHTVVPAIKSVDDRFSGNVQKALDHLAQADDCLESCSLEYLAKITVDYENNNAILIEELLKLHPYMQKRILIAWFCKLHLPFEPSESWLAEIIRFFCQPESKSHRVHSDWSLIKKGCIVYCERNRESYEKRRSDRDRFIQT